MVELTSKRLRAAIIGCGRIAGGLDDDPLRPTIWTHAGAYQEHPQVELVAAADLNPEALDAFGRRWEVPNLYADASDLLLEERIDILSICTWADTHEKFAMMGVEAGVKGIWCEKPITRSLSEADRLVALCRDIVLAINHTRRWDSCYLTSGDLVRQGALGKIQGLTCTYSGGVSNMGTHMFDMLSNYFGPAQAVWAGPQPAGNSQDPTPGGHILYKDGLLAQVVGAARQSYMVFEMDILGTLGRLKIMNNGHRVEFWEATASVEDSEDRTLQLRDVVFDGDEGARMVDELSDIIRCVEDGGRPACGGAEGRAALEVATAFLISMETGAEVPLPLVGVDRERTVPFREVL